MADGFDPVTDADSDAETAIRAVLARRFPEHGIIGEEWDAKASSGAYDWIVDPIDGTRAFISGVPVWGTLIGLMHEGRAIAGLMAQPFTGETWIGVGGTTIYSRGGDSRTVRTSASDRAGAGQTHRHLARDLRAVGHRAGDGAPARAPRCRLRWGLDCYGYCLLASGHIDLVAEAALKNVDIAPLITIIEGAGGVVTTWEGGPAEAGGNCLAAATPELHRAALAALNG